MTKAMAAALAALGATLLLLPATSGAAINRLDIGTKATLGPAGTSLTIPITYQCDVVDGSISLNVHVTQSTGKRIADGIGFPTPPCTGAPVTINALVNLSILLPAVVPFNHGKAAAQVDGFASGLQVTAGPQAIKIVG